VEGRWKKGEKEVDHAEGMEKMEAALREAFNS